MVVATYNGARFLSQQLESILNQTHSVDEVVVTDDGSTDGTLAIIEHVRLTGAPLRLLPDRTHVDVLRNFERGIAAARGDIVFLCDQDDVWRPQKVEVTVGAMAGTGAGAAFSDAGIIGREGTSKTLWEAVGFTNRRRRRWAKDPIGVLLQRNVVTGATLAADRRAIQPLLPLPRGGWHDLSLAVLLAAKTTVLPIGTPLIDYRLHSDNAAGLDLRRARDRRETRDSWEANLDAQASHWMELQRSLASGAPIAAERAAAKIAFLGQRRRMSSNARSKRILLASSRLLAGDYNRYANGLMSFARDVAQP